LLIKVPARRCQSASEVADRLSQLAAPSGSQFTIRETLSARALPSRALGAVLRKTTTSAHRRTARLGQRASGTALALLSLRALWWLIA
jgi:hypothetical protein